MGLPLTVPFSKVVAFVEGLGLSVQDVESVHLGVDAVTVVVVRRDENGGLVSTGPNLATVTTVMPFDRSA